MPFTPRYISFEHDCLKAKGLFRSKTIRFDDIKKIDVVRVASLVDEIGVTISADERIFFTDADRWFVDAAEALRFSRLFGEDWYARAESGEHLKHEGNIATR